MVSMLVALWKLARGSFIADIVELAGAAAIVYGADLQFGAGAAFIVAGVLALLKAFELDLEQPSSRGEGDG